MNDIVQMEYDYDFDKFDMKSLLIVLSKYGGTTVYIPSLSTVHKMMRDKHILELSNSGVHPEDIANEYTITRRRVDQILKKEHEILMKELSKKKYKSVTQGSGINCIE
ncbi:Mor transcription activator family protein [Intestinibacter sp.]